METEKKLVDMECLKRLKDKLEEEIKVLNGLYELDSDGDIMPAE